ncbi:MAG: chromosome segregation protein SMC, partial [Gammaproteobacteria bacterium]|nr:chromosome segregation protein SMC [Gammaproteobacteria bacterium]
TGVVGPNGCGKSNVIDAVRWVMGELSAKHLRGDSMTDVIFNGSSARKPVGMASVELLFDNSDGKIGGAYAGYNEVSLKRVVSRDGSSAYFLNGTRCRRRDITQLFLGTGLGSRSYAIIEQGMILRVIEAKADDMRAFVEEAAGISRYKERRRETESRIADTRENLERLQDLRDEVEKQIRHLQRQAVTARRHQVCKERERRLSAELLALKLRDLDSSAEVQDGAVRMRELAMQEALADQRAAEAAIEKQRGFHTEQGETLSLVQGRHYSIGADISRTEQTLLHARELRERQRGDLAQARVGAADVGAHIERDGRMLAEAHAEIARLEPELAGAQQAEVAAVEAQADAEKAVSIWQQAWEEFNRELGAAHQTTQVERARIEQLENQLRRLTSQSDRLGIERDALAAQNAEVPLAALIDREAAARQAGDELANALSAALGQVQDVRGAQLAAERQLELARGERERVRAELLSLEALQNAALGRAAGRAGEWLATSGLAERPRIAETLDVSGGWERAVETALGDYLEAVCVDGLDELSATLDGLGGGRVALVERSDADPGDVPRGSLAAFVQGPAPMRALLSMVRTAGSLADALQMRRSLGAGESVITREGEWLGRSWLRVNRGADQHAGVIEREHRLKTLRGASLAAEAGVGELEGRLAALREALLGAERERDQIQHRIQGMHREHADLLRQLEGLRARAQEAARRRERLAEEAGEVAHEIEATQAALRVAHDELDGGLAALDALDRRRPDMEAQREERRQELADARSRAQAAQHVARDLLVKLESRRSSERSVSMGLDRAREQSAQLAVRIGDLERELAGADRPIHELETQLADFLARRLEVESGLAAARQALESAEAELRALDERRMVSERNVSTAREAMEVARLAAQETRVRREALVEQFAATAFDLAELARELAPDATAAGWEEALGATRADLERLGQVNLAAIGELEEQTKRKEYLDRQFSDLTDALGTLEQAMKRIDKETRARFEDTFERINQGLKDKFPRLFGGGHAYLELVGEDPLDAGVAVMARPPGKRNSTIHLLSGGEKALTAVALVFSIFDLNPAPFCLLDEVDAPLDDHNVGRFCDIVREMSQRVQFIFITHNKTTMELASQLLGVTMSEPGVSRLVSVDVEEAVRLAAV